MAAPRNDVEGGASRDSGPDRVGGRHDLIICRFQSDCKCAHAVGQRGIGRQQHCLRVAAGDVHRPRIGRGDVAGRIPGGHGEIERNARQLIVGRRSDDKCGRRDVDVGIDPGIRQRRPQGQGEIVKRIRVGNANRRIEAASGVGGIDLNGRNAKDGIGLDVERHRDKASADRAGVGIPFETDAQHLQAGIESSGAGLNAGCQDPVAAGSDRAQGNVRRGLVRGAGVDGEHVGIEIEVEIGAVESTGGRWIGIIQVHKHLDRAAKRRVDRHRPWREDRRRGSICN